MCKFIFSCAGLLNFQLIVTNPLNGSTIYNTDDGFIDFDVVFVNSLDNTTISKYDVVVDLIQQSETNDNYKYHICMILHLTTSLTCVPIFTVWPNQNAIQRFAATQMLTGERSLTVFVMARDATGKDIFITEAFVEFIVKDMFNEKDIDLLSLTTENGEVRAHESNDIFDEVYRIGFWQKGIPCKQTSQTFIFRCEAVLCLFLVCLSLF